MKTLILESPGNFVAMDTAEPGKPREGEALVRIRRVGICGTDLHAYRGKQPFFTYPRILGHELGVEVVDVAPGQSVQIGDICSVEPYLNCGKCIACRRGHTNCCVCLKVLGVHIDGGMREYIHVPINKLHVSKTLSLEQLALVETLGIGAHAVHRAGLTAGENVLVVGAGPIGLSVIQFAQLEQVKLIVMDVSPSRLNFCKQQFKIAHTIEAANIDRAQAQLLEITNKEKPTVVFDATGNPNSMMNAFKFVAHAGRLVFVGLFQGDVTFHDPDFHRRETTLLASRNSTAADFRRIISLMEVGCVDTRPWITHRAQNSEMIEQFPQWLKPESGCIKAMVEF